jgi:hypothetical protein
VDAGRAHGDACRRRRQSDTAAGPKTARIAASAATVAKSTDTDGASCGSVTDARFDTICPFASVLESVPRPSAVPVSVAAVAESVAPVEVPPALVAAPVVLAPVAVDAVFGVTVTGGGGLYVPSIVGL